MLRSLRTAVLRVYMPATAIGIAALTVLLAWAWFVTLALVLAGLLVAWARWENAERGDAADLHRRH